jgi:hypothetical protein
MDHIATLIAQAGELRRHLLLASETYSSRLDRVFSTLLSFEGDIESLDKSARDTAGVGHTFAIMFLLAGVQGMPPIQGEDALSWMEKWKEENPGSWNSQVHKLSSDKRLPRNYGADIAGSLYASAMRVSGGRPDKVEDLVMNVLTSFLAGFGKDINPEPLSKAIGYVQNSIRNLGINEIKKHDRREHSLTRDTGEDEGLQEEISQDRSLDDVMDDKNARLILKEIVSNSRLRSTLERIHPDALLYLKLNMEGYDDREILGTENPKPGQEAIVVGPSLLKHPYSRSGIRLYPSSWSTMKADMFQAIKKNFMSGPSHSMHLAMVSSEFNQKLDEKFGPLIQKGDVEGLLREERKVVQGYIYGLKALNGVLRELKIAIELLVHVACPDPAFQVVWPTQKQGVVNLHNAYHTLQETKTDVLQTAYATESWFQKTTAQLGSVAPRFEWPRLV